MPREGEEGGEGGEGEEGGGGFWQSIFNYFGSCGEGDGSSFRAIIPPTSDLKHPDGDLEKQGPTEKKENNYRKPSKPFYYVLPPAPNINYYYSQPDISGQQNILPKYIASIPFKIPKAISNSHQVIARSEKVSNTKIPLNMITSNGHVNEKNVN